jgi:hypothetical protein
LKIVAHTPEIVLAVKKPFCESVENIEERTQRLMLLGVVKV